MRRCADLAPRPGAAGAKLRAGDLSARGLHKVTRVARTVADLAGEDVVSFMHVSEALSLRAARAACGRMTVDLPEQAYAAALASTQAVGPATLRAALADDRPLGGVAQARASQGATERDVQRVWQLHTDRGIRVVLADDAGLPRAPSATIRRPPPSSSVAATLPRFRLRPPWRWSAPVRRLATASAWRHSSGPTWPRPA